MACHTLALQYRILLSTEVVVSTHVLGRRTLPVRAFQYPLVPSAPTRPKVGLFCLAMSRSRSGGLTRGTRLFGKPEGSATGPVAGSHGRALSNAAAPVDPTAGAGRAQTKRRAARHLAPGARPAALPSPTPALSVPPANAPQPCRG